MLKRPDAAKLPSVAKMYDSLQAVYEKRYGVATPLCSDLPAPLGQIPIAPAVHLEYGGTPSKAQPEYRTGCMPLRRGRGRPKGIQFKCQRRLEVIARLENAGISEFQAATMLGISVPRLRQIKRSSDYLRARIAITHGLILDQESALANIREQRKEILTQMLPPALRVIANAVAQPPTSFPERVLQVRVAQDILDREGTFAKISRSEVRPVDRFDWSSSEHTAREVIQVVRGCRVATGPLEQPGIGGVAGTETVHQLEVARLIEITKAFGRGRAEGAIGGAEDYTEKAMKVLAMQPKLPSADGESDEVAEGE